MRSECIKLELVLREALINNMMSGRFVKYKTKSANLLFCHAFTGCDTVSGHWKIAWFCAGHMMNALTH